MERSTVASNRRDRVHYLLNSERLGDDSRTFHGGRGHTKIRLVYKWQALYSSGPWMTAEMRRGCSLRLLGNYGLIYHILYILLRMEWDLHSLAKKEEYQQGQNLPTNSMWFRRVMKGMHKRMGDAWIPDRPLTVRELKTSLEILEEDWGVFAGCNYAQGLKKMALTATMMVSGFFAALRGEEVVRIDVGSTRQHWKEVTGYKVGVHVPMTGGFKREMGKSCFANHWRWNLHQESR
jgi:hypothetical protein